MLAQIIKNYNVKINRLKQFYRINYLKILRMNIPLYYKKIYLNRLKQKYFYIKKKIDDYRDQQILKYKQKLSIKNSKKQSTTLTKTDVNATNNSMANEFKDIKALMVGINYINSNYELKGCINDVFNLKKFFNHKCKLNYQNVFLLTDNTKLKTNRETILKKYKDLLINSKSGDLLVFTYAGHGYYTRDRNRDERDGRDELLVASDFKCIKDDELKNILDKYLPNGVKVFILF